MNRGTLNAKVNGILALLFVGTFTLGAWLIVWHAAFGQNPVADVIAAEITTY